jgi:hypothetical protein
MEIGVQSMVRRVPMRWGHWLWGLAHRASGLSFTLFSVTLLWAHDVRRLALAFVVRGLKESGEPARKALIIGEASAERRARTHGAYYLTRDCIVTSGSFLGAWLWNVRPRANFMVSALCGALGTLWFWGLFVRRSPSASTSSSS